MANLVARGEEPQHQWLHELPPETVTLGSRPTESTWVVPWDKFISRVHATLTWREGKLFVRRHPRASNKIFFRSEALDEFALEVGEEFLIGSTSFSVQQSETNSVDVQPTPDVRFTCSAQELQLIEYTDADQRIEVLAALPGVIRYSPSDEELEARVVDALLRGIPRASAAAVVWLDPAPLTDDPALKVRYWSNRGREQEGFRPSRLLVLDAVRRLRQRVMHIWHGGGINPEYTVPAGSWAICVPLADEPAPGWVLYVTGMLGDQISGTGDPTSSNALKSDLKFVELVADIFGSLRQVRDLQGRQAHLSGFLSRPVLAALAEHDMDEVLMPRQTEVTVLFCDLRGSCRIAEEGQDELFGLWNRVGEARRHDGQYHRAGWSHRGLPGRRGDGVLGLAADLRRPSREGGAGGAGDLADLHEQGQAGQTPLGRIQLRDRHRQRAGDRGSVGDPGPVQGRCLRPDCQSRQPSRIADQVLPGAHPPERQRRPTPGRLPDRPLGPTPPTGPNSALRDAHDADGQ